MEIDAPKPASMGHGPPMVRGAKEYRDMTALDILKERLPWLATFFIGLIVCAVVVDDFQDELNKQVALSFFLPLIIGHGGNTGSQTVAHVIEAMARGAFPMRDATDIMLKETASSALIGAMLGLVVLVVGSMWGGVVTNGVAMSVAVSLPLVSAWSSFLGVALPVACLKLGVNASTVSAPLMSTLVDSTGLIIYFMVAKIILTW